MFDVGFTELFLLAVIGLLVLGPERLPAVARTLGGWMRKARSSWYTLKRSIESELSAADVRGSIKAAGDELKAVSRRVSQAVEESVEPGRKHDAEPGGRDGQEQAAADDSDDAPGARHP